ncbi:MAG: flagellar filament capping protein FliD [Proteobacteria bacterium]|nr:flagellar filament capping protein FliD [Pseudomonadota bacterium]
MAPEINSNPNVITGLSSGMDTKSIVEQMIAAERKKVEPIIARKDEKILELDAWKQVKAYLENTKVTADVLAKKSLWEGKIVTSSHPEVVEAFATSGAKPGKHTLIVDKLALSHQIASQGFSAKEQQIARGEVSITIGESPPEKIIIDETNDNLQGYVDAINGLDGDVTASIIKTGNKERPFQVVLTSKKTGKEGEIFISSSLASEGEMPSFEPYYLQPSKWKGISKAEEIPKKPTGTGASTVIPEIVGQYVGEDSLELTFTAVNTGIVGVSESLRMRWEDNKGRYGYLDLGSFNYTPGEPLELVDGLSLILSDGEIIVNDVFTAKAKPQESELYWWKSDAERAPMVSQPSSWKRQSTEGGPIITGKLDSEDDDVFTLTVMGSGQIGQAKDLKIEYESENGERGIVFVGQGYEPGSKLSLGKGLEISLKPGLLNDGDIATFEYQAESTADYWWLDDNERHEGGEITNLTKWISKEIDEDKDEFAALLRPKKPVGARLSNASRQIAGTYTEYDPKFYTFTVLKSGSVGVTKGLEIKWEDNKGNSGILDIGGDNYRAGAPIEFDAGLSLMLGEGSVFETDSFTFRTYTPVIQPPQDAEIRLGATELGGGLVITNSTNELDDVIDGVRLNLVSTSEKPVTISIRGDTEKALATIREFAESYNSMLMFFKEISKYEPETGESGPLQGDRNLPKIQKETNNIFINPVFGIEDEKNMMISIGLKINKESMIEIDEDKLTNAINDNLTTVANLFRSFGTMDNTGIIYLASNDKTEISGPNGYDIDITGAATKGMYTTKPANGFMTITEANKEIFVTVNGRESESITLETGNRRVEDVARELQKKIINDKNIGKMRVVVTSENGSILIRSNSSGSKSNVGIRAGSTEDILNHPLLGGISRSGTDVQGMINGTPMKGSGQILSGAEDTKYEGLKLYVSLTANQIGPGVEGNIVFTKGVGTRVREYIDQITSPELGSLDIYTNNVKEQLDNYENEIAELEQRISSKREKLTIKFAKMESQLGQLKNEQKYLAGEIAKLG